MSDPFTDGGAGSVETFIPLGTSHISQIGWDKDSEDLTVEFNDGSTYLYRNVPRQVYRSLCLDPHPGAYIHRHIKGRYMSDTV